MDCFCGHLSGFKKVELALQLRSLCGGIAKEKVRSLTTSDYAYRLLTVLVIRICISSPFYM